MRDRGGSRRSDDVKKNCTEASVRRTNLDRLLAKFVDLLEDDRPSFPALGIHGSEAERIGINKSSEQELHQRRVEKVRIKETHISRACLTRLPDSFMRATSTIALAIRAECRNTVSDSKSGCPSVLKSARDLYPREEARLVGQRGGSSEDSGGRATHIPEQMAWKRTKTLSFVDSIFLAGKRISSLWPSFL
jgi:hypothetical protein